jgi:hypothetical protein
MLATGIGVLAQGQDGGPATQEASASKPKPDPLQKASPKTTGYYIGDLLFVDPSTLPVEELLADSSQPSTGRPQVDMTPMIELITSTIEPEHWKGEDGGLRNITPVFLSLSLMIRGEPEVHDRVHALLMGLRRFTATQASVPGVSGKIARKLYDIGDLLSSPDDAPGKHARLDREALIELISSTTCPHHWSLKAQEIRFVIPAPDDRSIFVGSTPEGHKQIEVLLAALRRYHEAQPDKPPAAE